MKLKIVKNTFVLYNMTERKIAEEEDEDKKEGERYEDLFKKFSELQKAMERRDKSAENSFIEDFKKNWNLKGRVRIVFKGKNLGGGTFGTVYKGLMDKKKVAVKCNDTGVNVPSDDIFKEVAYQMSFNHENVLRVYGYVNPKPGLFGMVMERMDCDLLSFVRKRREKGMPLSLSEKMDIMMGCAKGLRYLHNREPDIIIHGDIKSYNILIKIDEEGNCAGVRYCDFGQLRKMDATKTSIQTSSETGSRYWNSPEAFDGILSRESDIYALGITYWELLYEESNPYPTLDVTKIFSFFKQIVLGVRPSLDGALPGMLKDLLEKMWHSEKKCRPSAHDLESWFDGDGSELQMEFGDTIFPEYEGEVSEDYVDSGEETDYNFGEEDEEEQERKMLLEENQRLKELDEEQKKKILEGEEQLKVEKEERKKDEERLMKEKEEEETKVRLREEMLKEEKEKRKKEQFKLIGMGFRIEPEGLKIDEKLGVGSSGIISSGTLSTFKGEEKVAVKSIKLGHRTTKDKIMEEIMMCLKVNGPGILKTIGFDDSMPWQINIVMELMDGNLQDYVKENVLNLEEKLEIMKLMTRGVAYLHSMEPYQVIHMDIKPINFLYRECEVGVEVKLGDFGLSNSVDDPLGERELDVYKGTMVYMVF